MPRRGKRASPSSSAAGGMMMSCFVDRSRRGPFYTRHTRCRFRAARTHAERGGGGACPDTAAARAACARDRLDRALREHPPRTAAELRNFLVRWRAA